MFVSRQGTHKEKPRGFRGYFKELLGDFGHFLARFDASLFDDNLRVTEQGCELLTSSPRELRILGA